MTNDLQTRLLDFLTSIDIDSIKMESCYRYNEKSTNTTRHSHKTFELSFFLKGEQVISLDDVTMQFREYDLVGHPPGCEHQGVLTPQEVLTIKLDIQYNPLYKGCSFKLCDKSGTLRWLFEHIYYENHHKQAGSERLIQNYTEAILLHIIRYYRTVSNFSMQESFRELLTYITNNCHLDITLEQMASMLNVSKSYLHKMFKANTGNTPLQYLNEARIHYAKKLLQSTDSRIQDISYLVGFQDPRYFTRVFSEFTGQSPSDWRKKA